MIRARAFAFPQPHFLSVLGLTRPDAEALLDFADTLVALNRRSTKKLSLLRGRTLVNLFFESSTRTQSELRARSQAAGGRHDQHGPAQLSVTKGRR